MNEKTSFQSVPIAALCLYNIQRENLVFKNSLCNKDADKMLTLFLEQAPWIISDPWIFKGTVSLI